MAPPDRAYFSANESSAVSRQLIKAWLAQAEGRGQGPPPPTASLPTNYRPLQPRRSQEEEGGGARARAKVKFIKRGWDEAVRPRGGPRQGGL